MRKLLWPLLVVNLNITGLIWRGAAYFVQNNTTIIENICKGWSRQREHRRCYNISAGQHQPSSGLLNG